MNVRRGGFYFGRPQQFPLVLGNEAAGVIEALGEGVGGFSVGERVAYAGMRGEFFEDTGAYTEARNVPAERLLKVPDSVSDRQAAAMLVKGFTAWLIINRLYRPKAGDTILIHGIAGGVGFALGQWSRHLGATVIGTVGSEEKAAFVRQHACDHAVLYRETDFVAAVQADRAAGRRGGVRRRRQGHLPCLARMRAPLRHAGELRQCVGPSAAARPADAREERLALASRVPRCRASPRTLP